ncbi:MAG: DNA double-strand break repair nuclease NurA [Candidatus Bathyarchaeota archaeon]|nr:DNA double-strand break repair nuclease NurA [Candidatus Bathyarchaeota archaeon]MCZ2845917.1 DNA double-strand break repair nuclease NurA [Candidatus Bathyarchaeota archaeon]
MSLKATKKLIKKLDALIVDGNIGEPHFSDKSIKTFPLDRNGFKLIRESESKRKLFFVDGGNQEIIGAPNFSLQLNRISFGIWSGKNRISEGKIPRKFEFFSATHSSFRDEEIHYDTTAIAAIDEFEKFIPDERDLSFNSLDRTVMNGNSRADIGRVASIARRFAEWQFANILIENEMEYGDVLVLDGTLQSAFTNERKYLERLYESARKKGVVITGLSKTSSLFTTTGLSLLGAVNELAEEKTISREWYYIVAESQSVDHNVVIFFLKLNKASERIFRYEVQREKFYNLSDNELVEIMTLLVKNSSDATFPGYPYGLIDVDRLARVSYDEIEYYRGMILSQMNELGKWRKFSRHIYASDAHSILNILVG